MPFRQCCKHLSNVERRHLIPEFNFILNNLFIFLIWPPGHALFNSPSTEGTFMKLFYIPILVLALILPQISSAQITVTYPSDRVVFQRDNANRAAITIAGYFSGCVDRVEARFVPRAAGQGIESPAGGGWATIQSNPVGGNFYGSLSVSGGWYKLEVRAILDNAEVGSGTVEHVGAGEVFVVAGQSNATGGDGNANGPGATDDRVNSVNFQNVNANNFPGIAPYADIQLPCPEFVHLDASTKTAPFGNYAWCWGAFGDSLVKKLQVPVMIFNAGWSSTGIRNWQETINTSQVTVSEFGYVFPTGLPFGHLRIALNNYIAQLGVRAVLWHQGETDNLVSRTDADYLKDIREVIQATRDLTGKDKLAWVVSRVSRFPVDGVSRTWQPVIDAQNDVIGIGSHGNDMAYKLPDVFAGPATDDYWDTNYRSDQVHFSGAGLLHLAGWWSEKLNQDFFGQSTPYAAIPPPNVTISRTETADVILKAPNGWSGYSWLSADNCNNSLSGSAQFTSSSGDYKLQITDSFKNVIFSPKLKIPGVALPTSIAINTDMSQQTIHTGANGIMATDCRIIGEILPSAGSPQINGTLTTKVIIDPLVQVYQNAPYLQRHFDIKTDVNGSINSRLTLFFSQQEFDAFNVASSMDLAKNPTDQAGINNLRIVQFQGTSSNGSIGSYAGSRSEIMPASVVWNNTLSSWIVSFDVTSTGGFFVSTINSALPVTLKYFSGYTTNNASTLEWASVSEKNSSHFEIERSTNAINFQMIGKVSAAGDSKSVRQYTYQDYTMADGIYYYRLKQVDLDGSFEYSRIISLKVTAATTIKVYPNPVNDQLSIQSEIEINSVEITNPSGIKLQSARPNSHYYNIEMTKLPAGLYLIKINNEVFKIVKK